MRRFARGSRSRLTPHDLGRFSGPTLFDRLGRVVCEAACLPRRELFEAWEVARRARRLFRGGRVVDLAGGHGLLAHIMLLLDDTSPDAIVVDTRIPASASTLHDALGCVWPALTDRVRFVTAAVESTQLDAGDIAVSCHACGALTDTVITVATAAGARLAVLPCCHDETTCDAGPLTAWLDRALAIDVMRAARLQAAGYRVRTQVIPADITTKNRLLLASRE